MSRSERPKQFLSFQGAASLYQDALRRVDDGGIYHPALVVTNAEYRFLVAEQAAEIAVPVGAILLEPLARNTAAAIAAAAIYVRDRHGGDTLLHILPADHAVIVDSGYWRAIDHAAEAARRGYLATFGMTPACAETGYGYLKAGACVGMGFNAVEQFIEKPDVERAGRMVDAGEFLWNSGMFMFGATAFLAECGRLVPQINPRLKRPWQTPRLIRISFVSIR